MDKQQELINYIRSSLKSGKTHDEIKTVLVNAGWEATMIEGHLLLEEQNSITTPQTVPSSTISQPTQFVSPAQPMQPGVNGQVSAQPQLSSNGLTAQDETKSVSTGKATKVLTLILLIGLVLIGVFLGATFLSGKTVYRSEKIMFNQAEQTTTNKLVATPAGNPYRVIMAVNYSIEGNPFQSRNELFTYSFSLKDPQEGDFLKKNNTFSHTRSSSDSDKSSYSKTNVTSSAELATFSVPKEGEYTITLLLNPKTDLDEHFKLNDVTYEIKSGVTIIPIIVPVVGIVLISISLLGFWMQRKKEIGSKAPSQ